MNKIRARLRAAYSNLRDIHAQYQLWRIERQNDLGWETAEHSQVLNQMVSEHRNPPCPKEEGGCGGTRCWDWRRNGRPCGDNPTTASASFGFLLGRHFAHSVRRVGANWWPLPRTFAARTRPDLWRRVADHCQISLSRPVGTVLP